MRLAIFHFRNLAMTAIMTSLFRRNCSLRCLLAVVLAAAWQFPALARAAG